MCHRWRRQQTTMNDYLALLFHLHCCSLPICCLILSKYNISSFIFGVSKHRPRSKCFRMLCRTHDSLPLFRLCTIITSTLDSMFSHLILLSWLRFHVKKSETDILSEEKSFGFFDYGYMKFCHRWLYADSLENNAGLKWISSDQLPDYDTLSHTKSVYLSNSSWKYD